MIAPEKAELLAQPLDRSAIKQREAGGGKKLSYIETHHAVRTANLIFGFGGWGHEIVELRPINAVSIKKDGKEGWHVGYICIVKLTVDDCKPMSGIGYGDATEYRNTALVTAHELAAKEAESDALKRALKNFGDQFGLALYDKDADRSGHIAEDGSQASRGAPASSTPQVVAAKSWAELTERLSALGVLPADTAEWLRQAKEAAALDVESEAGKLTMFQCANQMLVAVTLHGDVAFDANPRPALREIVAKAFKLAAEVDGPPWRIGPEELVRPTKDEYDEAVAEALRLSTLDSDGEPIPF